MSDFKQLRIFQKAREFNKELYLKTKYFPREEQFGLTSQIWRASLSIATNISEGCGRKNDKEFARFLDISYASACEVECLLLIASDIEIITQEEQLTINEKLDDIKKMTFSFARKLRAENG